MSKGDTLTVISVIVPIYNVETFLPRCIDSLTKQTYDDIEFILVDDGSTDNSGIIAEQYRDDSRFFVYHTMNKGLSAARNYGLGKARGEWLMFVDGDDWVEADFCETPVNEAIHYNADMVIFQWNTVKKGKRKKGETFDVSHLGVVSWETAIEYGEVVVWNKLYKRSLFTSVSFPDDQAYEDVAITHKIIHQAQKIVMIPNILYNYVNRRNSISHTRSTRIKKDGFKAALQRYSDLVKYGYPKEKLEGFLLNYTLAYLATADPNEDYHEAEQIVYSIRGMPHNIPLKMILALLVWKFDKRLFYILCRFLMQ